MGAYQLRRRDAYRPSFRPVKARRTCDAGLPARRLAREHQPRRLLCRFGRRRAPHLEHSRSARRPAADPGTSILLLTRRSSLPIPPS